nr:hypothetical protein [Paracoccus saliphilus]
MARGFLTGIVHGGLLSAAVLTTAAVLMPPPNDGAEPAAVDLPEPEAVPADPAPQPDAIDLPVGSEFGRGADQAPVLPDPGAALQRDSRAPAAVPPPRTEPAPAARTRDNIRPEAAANDQMPVQSSPSAGEDAPDVDMPAQPVAQPRSQPLAVPMMAVEAPRDDLPPITWTQDANPAPAPALPAPALDLSLPPDLTDLRRMERN